MCRLKRDNCRVLVHNRLRIQRGQAFVGMITSTLIAVGVYRDHFPQVPWLLLMLVGGIAYLALAWGVGYVDERMGLFRIEQERYNTMNPQVQEILEMLRKVDRRL